MFIKTEKNRDYYKCNLCNKPMSYKVGKPRRKNPDVCKDCTRKHGATLIEMMTK